MFKTFHKYYFKEGGEKSFNTYLLRKVDVLYNSIVIICSILNYKFMDFLSFFLLIFNTNLSFKSYFSYLFFRILLSRCSGNRVDPMPILSKNYCFKKCLKNPLQQISPRGTQTLQSISYDITGMRIL